MICNSNSNSKSCKKWNYNNTSSRQHFYAFCFDPFPEELEKRDSCNQTFHSVIANVVCRRVGIHTISKTLCRFVKAVEEGRRVGGLRSGEDEGAAQETGRGGGRTQETRGNVQEQGTSDSMGTTGQLHCPIGNLLSNFFSFTWSII